MGQAWSSALAPLAFGSGLARQDEAWIGMIIYGNRQPYIGNFPEKTEDAFIKQELLEFPC